MTAENRLKRKEKTLKQIVIYKILKNHLLEKCYEKKKKINVIKNRLLSHQLEIISILNF